MSDSKNTTLKSVDWFPRSTVRAEEGVVGALVKLAIGLAVGGVFFAFGARKLAIVVWVLAALIGLVSIASKRARTGIVKFFAKAGFFIGRWLTVILLVPVHLIGFTAARLLTRLSGGDPLHLRDVDRPTYWLSCDSDARKVRHIRAMYTTEAATPAGRRLLPFVAGALGLLLSAEIVLRLMGFGDPVIYRVDAASGYYPAPNQDVSRSGGRTVINEFGMRSPPVKDPKPEGELRVLMIGDSTLFGGSYIDQDDLYSRRLESLLQGKANGRPIEVISIGVNGWGPFHKLGYLEKYGTFNADIAIVCLPYGDIYRPLSGLEGKPYLPENARPTFALQEVVHHLLWRAQTSTIGPLSEADKDYHARRGIKAYLELGQTLRDAGSEVFFAVLPSRAAGLTGEQPADERRRVAELTEAFRVEGFTVDYPTELFRSSRAGGRKAAEIYHDEVHLDREGHRLYAEWLSERITTSSQRFNKNNRASKGDTPSSGSLPGSLRRGGGL